MIFKSHSIRNWVVVVVVFLFLKTLAIQNSSNGQPRIKTAASSIDSIQLTSTPPLRLASPLQLQPSSSDHLHPLHNPSLTSLIPTTTTTSSPQPIQPLPPTSYHQPPLASPPHLMATSPTYPTSDPSCLSYAYNPYYPSNLHTYPYSPSPPTHSRHPSNPTSGSIPPPLTIQPAPYTSSLPPHSINTPTYHHPAYYSPPSAYPTPPPPQPAYAQPPCSQSSQNTHQIPSPSGFSPYPSLLSSPPGSDPSSYPPYPIWQDPYPAPSLSYEPTYQHMSMPYLAFRDPPASPRPGSGYPPHFSFSPPQAQIQNQDAYQRTYREHPHPSPLNSPYTSPGPHTPHAFRSPIRQSAPHSRHLPRYGPFTPRAPYSPTSPPSTYGPKSPASPPAPDSLVRGSLAQAKLRNVLTKRELVPQQRSTSTSDRAKHSKIFQRPALPRPPSHSEHALWVGNVPNDASHEELWKFFTGSGSPIPSVRSSHPRSSAGVESVHLISRSNCAFVNYHSDAHLQHAITVSNGKSLRPLDPRCKPLVCRVRKVEDNVKSGVGAQRIGGMHRSWIRNITPASTHTRQPLAPPEAHSNRASSTSTFHSNGTTSATASTSSSFLTQHFPRRYFILKVSH